MEKNSPLGWPRLLPGLLPEYLWWAHSPGCPPPTPGKEIRSALGRQPHFGTEESDIYLIYINEWEIFSMNVMQHWIYLWSELNGWLCWIEKFFFMFNRNLNVKFIWKPRPVEESNSYLSIYPSYLIMCVVRYNTLVEAMRNVLATAPYWVEEFSLLIQDSLN